MRAILSYHGQMGIVLFGDGHIILTINLIGVKLYCLSFK